MLEKFRTAYKNSLFIQILTVTLVVFLSVAIMIPVVMLAEAFGIHIRGNTGSNFDVSFGNVFFFFLFGICSIGIIWLAQKKIHQKKLAELGFQGKIGRTILMGFIIGALLVLLKYTVFMVSAEQVKFVKVIPSDVSIVTYLAYYLYFMVGFIFWNSFIEELGTRAYPIQRLKKSMNPHIVFIIMGLIFSVGHFVLNDFSLGYFLSLFLFSYIFSLLYFYSNSIWLPIGLHSGVNWLELSFFGTNWKLGAIYTVEIYNIPDWSYHYANAFILSGFLLLIIYLNKKGFFKKYFPGETSLEIKRN